MRTLLVALLVVGVVVAACYLLFPWWYLNTSPRVLMQPKSMIAPSKPPNEQEGTGLKPDEPNLHPLSASDPTQLMYLDQKLETRLASGMKQMEPNLPVLKIGIGTDADYQVAGIEFWVGDQPQEPVLERETLEVVYTAYRMVPTLAEVDIYGVDQPDTRARRGQQLYSLVVKRDAFRQGNPRLMRHEQIAQWGSAWLSPTLQEPANKH